ncbi:hypothetical protein C7M79_13865 [Clostridium botulinum]|uniref:hypothetical protein n=1 Tax=Clostridium botulinum TaxID=1491 RepID=UPI000D1FE2E7|nr:hypothetical protein C7M79_13865 [Clostridium botulinum]
MSMKSEVLNSIEEAITELNYIQIEVDELVVSENREVDTSLVTKYIEDVKDAINKIRDCFEDYDDEVSDIEDDLEGIIYRLNEVIK